MPSEPVSSESVSSEPVSSKLVSSKPVSSKPVSSKSISSKPVSSEIKKKDSPRAAEGEQTPKYSRLVRISALVALVLLAGLYLAALICAFIDHPLARSILAAALFCTIVIPVMLYVLRFTIRMMRRSREEDGRKPE